MFALMRSLHNFKCFCLLLPSAVFIIASVLHFVETVCGETSALDLSAKILHYDNRPPNAQGDFSFEFQTSNGITTKAAGNLHGISGVVQYVSKEGIPITMTYVADANGYHPEGEHIPTLPNYVQRALEHIRSHKQEKSRTL